MVEKESFVVEPRPSSYAHKKPAVLIIIAFIAVLSLQWLWQSQHDTHVLTSPPHEDKKGFRWEDITPSTSLEYHQCFTDFQCARLEVPLDWNETIAGESDKVAIAIIKRPAKVEITDPRYAGVILLNPGGPGGSGVSLMLTSGQYLQLLLDSVPQVTDHLDIDAEDEKYFDLLSWDPRGVNNTTPGHGCIPDPIAQRNWISQNNAIGFSLEDEDVFRNVYSRGRLLGQTCANVDGASAVNRVNGGEHLGQYVSTANVVRDMVEIVERHGEWREKHAKALLSRSCARSKDAAAILERTAWQQGEEQLQYWGFSYGTVSNSKAKLGLNHTIGMKTDDITPTQQLLGQTFATMQPHRVRRMVLDGVVDGADYMGNGWLKNILDIDGITAAFAAACFRAGPVLCAAHDARGPPAILATLSAVLADVRSNPLPAFHDAVPTTISHSDVVLLLFSLWYSPLFGFPLAASAIAQLGARNGTALAALKASYAPHICDLPAARERDTAGAQIAILCSDGDGHARGDIGSQDAFRAYLDALRAQSPMFHERWAQVRLPCAGFDVRAKWRFEGAFGARTAHPVLFTSQSLDPVTPLPNAAHATRLFPGSVLLETKGLGHCAVSMPSVQGLLAVREYFRTGELPPNGTTYEVYEGPFGERAEEVLRTEGERRVADAGLRLAGSLFEEIMGSIWSH
ncbi:hypothetical protein MMC26_001569 [Xylographa opegraphella]|nr:hypothetical protein [Xylographa opegraphella]